MHVNRTDSYEKKKIFFESTEDFKETLVWVEVWAYPCLFALKGK